MAEIITGFATTCADRLIDLVTKEVKYLCCYKTYVNDFKNEIKGLSATVESVHHKIKEAEKRNETEIDPVVQEWLRKAEEDYFEQDIKPKKWFGLCNNCFSQYSLAKELEKMTGEIPMIMDKVKDFPQVARAAGPPGMEFYSQDNFMPFESRALTFEQLMKELEDENNHRIGLQGIGEMGKTTMAIEVGKEVEKSKLFDKVIFIEVPNPVDERQIRDGIAKQLELQLKEEEQSTHAEQIWTRIANAGKVLIILDDVWEELNLKSIGIQPGFHRNRCCSVLLTTPYVNICNDMNCQKMIKLEDLHEKDALELFLSHASGMGRDYADDLKRVALDIVNECGRLPVIIVAVAKTIRNNWQPNEWQDALTALKNAQIKHQIVNEKMPRFYSSLTLSYDKLKGNTRDFFLLCSIFPRAYEIPIELLRRIAIGLELFGEVDRYYEARSQVPGMKNELINSTLLLDAAKESVKVHDVIREAALQIANEKIQVVEDSKTGLKENMKYSSWTIDDFPNCFDGSKLEVLMVRINASGSLEVLDAFFGEMTTLSGSKIDNMSMF